MIYSEGQFWPWCTYSKGLIEPLKTVFSGVNALWIVRFQVCFNLFFYEMTMNQTWIAGIEVHVNAIGLWEYTKEVATYCRRMGRQLWHSTTAPTSPSRPSTNYERVFPIPQIFHIFVPKQRNGMYLHQRNNWWEFHFDKEAVMNLWGGWPEKGKETDWTKKCASLFIY